MPRPSKPAIGIFVRRFPVLSETFVTAEVATLAKLGHRVCVEAHRRPPDSAQLVPAGVEVHWVEDETRAERLRALLWLIVAHPRRCLADFGRRRPHAGSGRGIPLRQLAVRARRLARIGPVHLHTHFATVGADEAYRVARLIGATTSLTAHAYDIYTKPRGLPARLRRSDFATSGCEYTVEHLRQVAGPGHSGAVFKQIMGIDPEAFRRSTPLPGGRHVVAVGPSGGEEGVRPPGPGRGDAAGRLDLDRRGGAGGRAPGGGDRTPRAGGPSPPSRLHEPRAGYAGCWRRETCCACRAWWPPTAIATRCRWL